MIDNLARIRKEYNAYREDKRGYAPGGLLADILWLLDFVDELLKRLEEK